MRSMLKERYPDATDQQIEAMVTQFQSQAKAGQTVELNPPDR